MAFSRAPLSCTCQQIGVRQISPAQRLIHPSPERLQIAHEACAGKLFWTCLPSENAAPLRSSFFLSLLGSAKPLLLELQL